MSVREGSQAFLPTSTAASTLPGIESVEDDVGMPEPSLMLEAMIAEIRGDLPVRLPDMDAIIELINEGAYDEHLEDILAAAHGRKRERRGCRRPYGRT